MRYAFPVFTLVLLLAGQAHGHDWQELQTRDIDKNQLEQLMTSLEQEQASLPADTAPLTGDVVSGESWLRWLEDALQLDTHEGQLALATRLPEYGFKQLDKLRVLVWTHEAEHLASAYDALQTNLSPEQIEGLLAELEKLDPDNPEQVQKTVELSTQLSNATLLTPKQKPVLQAFAPRIQSLIKKAQALEGKP